MKRKYKLTLNRVKKHKTKLNLKFVSSWIKSEDEIFCYTEKISPMMHRTEVTVKTTVFSPKSITRITPSKSITPKKHLKRNFIKSPKEIPRSITSEAKTPSRSPHTKKVRKCLEEALVQHSPVTELSAEQSTEDNLKMTEAVELLPNVLENLAEVGCDKTFIEFLHQVTCGQFPLQNISFLLWLEVVKWFSCENTCNMRYSDATKKFWKLGYRLFGGRFIHFMGGYKNTDQQEKNLGIYSPHESDINFSVPNLKVLRDFMPYDIPCVEHNTRGPGILTDMIESMAKVMHDKSCCITFDGKKLKQGLTKTAGDVDILGYEKGDSINDKRKALENLLRPVVETIDALSEVDETLDIRTLDISKQENLKYILLAGLKAVSSQLLDIKDMRKKKEYAKQKLIERSGESDWRNSKYVRAISSMIAFLHDIDMFLTKSLSLIEELLKCISYLNNAQLIEGEKMCLQKCKDYIEIPDNPITEIKNTREIKQRTELWIESRKSAKVTGSTMFKALALDGLAKQKEHFDNVICGLPEKETSDKTKEAMQYGTINEPNATATFVGKVMPVIFPNKLCFEEGYVELGVLNGKPFMIVSPDGSVRDTQDQASTVAGIELKCPLTDIHKEVPQRYVLQCLSEIEALNVNSLIYLCWRPDISTVYRVSRKEDLFNEAYNLAHSLYGQEKPKRPTKISTQSKALKQSIDEARTIENSIEFIGVVPSLKNDPDTETVYSNDIFLIRRAQYALKTLSECYEQYYNLNREPATEAVVFLCCDLDREWEKDNIRCGPICWFTKGYSLDTETMRKVLESVLDDCAIAGLHVPAISFDGQWHNICVRDIKNNPLTILQLQKDLWKSVENMSKGDILKEMKSLNKQYFWGFEEIGETDNITKRVIVATNGNKSLPVISKRVAEYRLKTKSSKEADKLDDRCVNEGTKDSESELCATIISGITDNGENSANSYDIRSGHLEELDKEDFSDEVNFITEADQAEQSVLHNDELLPAETVLRRDGNVEDNLTTYESETSSNEPVNRSEKQQEHDKRDETNNHVPLNLSNIDAGKLLAMFQTDQKCNNKGQWNTKNPSEILKFFQSPADLKLLRDIELKLVVRYLKAMHVVKINESETKAAKITKLSQLLGLDYDENNPRRRKSKHTGQVKHLSDLAFSQFSKVIRKGDLNIIYAEYLWPSHLENWEIKYPVNAAFPGVPSPLNATTEADELDNKAVTPEIKENQYQNIQPWFYSPAFSESRQQFEITCIDSTHLFTRARRKSCKGGLDGLSNGIWRKVAKSNNTSLSLAMIDCIFEPMSAAMALTHFSEAVEQEMINNGDYQSASLCNDIRSWWYAEDNPGISASDRITMRMPLRQRLLSHVNFSHFPPPTMHINGWPIQLWEALIANIDAKILLYRLSHKNTYNVRAFSSMMGETFFSELTLYDRRGQGTVTSEEFGNFIQTSVEKLHMRLDPERTFAYRTSKKTAYKLVDKTDMSAREMVAPVTKANDPYVEDVDILIRDHSFDSQKRLKTKGKKKEGTIKTDRNAVQRGALGVRWETARRNENKLLKTMRMGIDIKNVEGP